MEGWGTGRKKNKWSDFSFLSSKALALYLDLAFSSRHSVTWMYGACSPSSVRVCVFPKLLCLFLCISCIFMLCRGACVCVCVCQALMSLCSHISIHATTTQASPLINFALQFKKKKKAYHKFPISFTWAPGAHKTAYLYWSPLPEIVFQRNDIILCPSSIKGLSALQRPTNIKVTQEQEDTSKSEEGKIK